MSRRRRPTAFTAPFLASHGDAKEAAVLRRAGEILAARRETDPPRQAAFGAPSARLRLDALGDELHHLATWAGGALQLVQESLDDGEVEAAYLYRTLATVGFLLAPMAGELDDALRDTAAKAAAWDAGRGDPFEAGRQHLLRMASTMRVMAPEVLRRWEAMLPLLPDETTRELMAKADQETEEVSFYRLRDSILGEVLAEGISRLETWAGTSSKESLSMP